MVWRLRAPARGGFYSFGQVALRSARARGRAGFFFKLVLALVARGRFFLLVKWLALRAGQSAGLVFSLSWFSRLCAGLVFYFGQMACAPRGPEVGRGDSKHPSLPLARAERKLLDQKKKPAPRHQRENQLKEKTSPASGPRGAQAI